MFFLELLYYLLLAFIAIFTWERIKLKVDIPVLMHLKSILFQLLCTLLVAITLVFTAIFFNVSYKVTGLITALATVFVWLYIEFHFPREKNKT
tara:strand:- start:113 stop:391 length:279 start_codon:yes stop_codon:yes gene_type:complete